MVPFVVIAVLSIVQHNHRFEWYMESYSLLLCVVFFIIYVREVWCYGRWLRDNYADLEHKEVWQSLVLIACILLVYIVYTTNEGALATEYLAQWLTLAIILFIVWRVDTLERLVGEQVKVVPIVDGAVSEQAEDAVDDVIDTGADVAMLLQTRCETTLLYVQHDLTLSQLAAEIGTSRATLNAWLSEQGDTYHAYINRLRIDHFIDIYRESLSVEPPYTIYELVTHCGYSSYATFSTAFRKRTGLTLAQWMKKENLAKKSTHYAYNRYESR
jgi:AraC-like DNA-binding protein